MGADTRIAWAHDTFNPWVGCARVSQGCARCYAESWAKRTGRPELWRGERRRTTPANWRKPVQWNAEAERSGAVRRVFCASLADVADEVVSADWRADLVGLIRATPALTWLLLTKRTDKLATLYPDLPPNVWVGTTVEDERVADRIDTLRAFDTAAAVKFLSVEPLIGPLDLRGRLDGIGWVIVGGESGQGARRMSPIWLTDVVSACREAGVPVFVKQFGAVVAREAGWSDRAGTDPDEWPVSAGIWPREFPS